MRTIAALTVTVLALTVLALTVLALTVLAPIRTWHALCLMKAAQATDYEHG